MLYNVDSLVRDGGLILPQRVITLRPEVELHARPERCSWVMPQQPLLPIPMTPNMRRSAEYPASRLLREQVHSPTYCEGCEMAKHWGGPCRMCMRERMNAASEDEAIKIWDRYCAAL